MKFHILRNGEGLKDILAKYQINYDTFKRLNPNLLQRNLMVGDKIRIDADSLKITKLNFKKEILQNQCICPYCKNTINLSSKTMV